MLQGKNKRIISLLLIMVLCFGIAFEAEASSIEDAKKKAEELEGQKSAAESQKASLTEQLNAVLGEMEETQKKLAAKEDEIAKKEEELIQAKVDENDQYESMKKRIKYMYENGNAEFIEILCDSKNIGEFLNNAEYITTISEYDREQLVKFQEIIKLVEEQEAALQEEYAELTELQTELENKQNQVEQLLAETNMKIEDLEEQIGENAALLEKLMKEAEEAAERKRQAEAAAAAAAAAAKAAASASNTNSGSSYTEPGPSVVSGSGQFTHPCPSGYITSYFGEYRSPSDPAHKGMDFGTNHRPAPTYAAAAGTVVIAGWSNSAGNWVVINHGNGLVTKYMHHSSLCVSAGQRVEKGQQIGMSGTTGQSSGIHLHFQVEVNGRAVDPRNYL